MRVVFMGSPEFAVAPLEYLVQNDFDLAAVYTQPDRPAGRGRQVILSPVKRVAQRLGLNIQQPVKLGEPAVINELKALQPEVIVVAAFGRILPPAVLTIPKLGCVNLHPSLLPKHRGASPVVATILEGDEFAGISIMLMNEGLDTGPVLTREQIPVNGSDTTGSLSEKLSFISARLLVDVLRHWSRGELKVQPQNDSLASYSPPVKKEEGEINWCLSAGDIWRRLRAFQPWPGAFTIWQGKRLEILIGFPLPWPDKGEPGTVVDLRPVNKQAAFGVVTGDGVLGICVVQLAGKKAMSSADFLCGQMDIVGAKLPSD